MSENILAQKSFTVRRAAKGSYTFLRYSNDGGKTFTASLPYADEGEVPGQNLLKGSEQPGFYSNLGGNTITAMHMEDETGKFTRYTPDKGKHVSLSGYPWEGIQNGGYSLSMEVRPIGKPITVTEWEGQTVPPNVWTRIEWNDVRKDGKYVGLIVDWRTGTDVVVDLRRLKLERGVSSTAWTPHPGEQLFGLTPGTWLGTAVWDKPYPPLTTDAYTWTKVKGEDGKDGTDGKDAANVYLSTQMLLVNTNDSGVVKDAELAGAKAQVLAYRGDEQIEATIVSCQCSPEVAAETQDGDTIKLTAVLTDEDTHMAYGSGYIDIVAEVEGKNYPLRLFVGVNITKFTASVVSDVRSFRQEFGKYQQTTDGAITWTKSCIEQKAREITAEVSARSQGVNLLQGTDFLGDLTTRAVYRDGATKITFGDDPQKAHTGHRYMHVEAKGNSSRVDAGKSWTARVESGKKYTASMWMMTPDKNSIDLDIYLECLAFKGGKDPVWLNHHVTPMAQNNTWYAHSDTFGIPDGYDTLQVFAFVMRNGDVYFSEVQLEEGDTRSAWSPYVGDREASLEKSGITLMPGCFQVDAKKMIVNGDLQAKSVLAESSTQYSLMRDGQFELGRIGSDTEHHKNIDFAFDGNGNPVLRFYRPDGSLMGVIDESFFASSAAGDTWQETAPMARLGDIRYSPTKHDVVNYNGSFRTFQKFQCGFTLYGDTKRYNHTGEGFPPYYDGYTYTDRKSTIATDAEMQTGFIPNGVYLIKPDKNWRFYKKEATGNLYIRLYRCEVYAAGRLSNHFLIEEVADESQVNRKIE